ncbi:hypothetical protein PSTT_14068 [Puccinia striiformis]|uniref:Uncharacterized protein n=1 Tax=Puccinia striiformis TaxID=27350 RepID=A0A2S4UNV2_9BASI|nr:hypothetical protein PSTT_14068 [Puccinia striiformis]
MRKVLLQVLRVKVGISRLRVDQMAPRKKRDLLRLLSTKSGRRSGGVLSEGSSVRPTEMLQACFIRKLGRASDRKWYENLLIFASKRNSRGLIIYNNLPCCPIDILATKDNRMSVADILNDRNYFPNPKDEETVEQYFSGIPQIKFSSGKSGQNLREISRSAQRTNSMQEDFESLEESLRRIGRPDMGFYEYINPIEYFAPSGWDKHHTLYQDVQKLRGIHQIMKRNLHALNRNSPIYTSAKEMDMICNKLVERLVDIFCSTEPAFASKNKLHFLNLQRLIFETIYFFQKHHLVDSDKLGSLLTSRATAEALSRHILRSYDEEAKPKEWLPLNSKSILKQWFNYTCGNMFKEFHQNQINSFTYYFHKCAFQYYHNYPENQKLKKMNNLMKFLERAVFDNASFERSEDNGSEYILPITNQGVHKLTHNFLQIYLNGNPDTELNHVFQAIEFIEDMSPLAFERYKFSGKFKLMSFTNGILEDIENVKGYLKNKFARKIG